MKLTELRTAIRGYKGNPSVVVHLGGTAMTVVLQKTVFLEELARVYNNDRGAETNLVFHESNGFIEDESAEHFGAKVEADDEDML